MRLQFLDTSSLHLAAGDFALLVRLAESFELVVVFEKESQVLEGHVDGGAAADFLVQLDGILATREGLIDFLLDLVVRVAEEDARVGVAGGHLRLGAFEGGEEDGVDDGWFDETDSGRVVPALPEIRVLVDGAGDQTRDFDDFFGIGAEDEGEARGKGGGGLRGWKGKFGDIVAVVEAKRSFDLVVCRSLTHFTDIGVKGSGETTVDELGICEDECVFQVEAYSYDV